MRDDFVCACLPFVGPGPVVCGASIDAPCSILNDRGGQKSGDHSGWFLVMNIGSHAHDLEAFRARCGMIVVNRWSDDLVNVAEKVYTRDLFKRD